jgi:ubiquinone/menaquinone biosynthesis C-methylase UbiE
MGKNQKQSSKSTISKDNRRHWNNQVYPLRIKITGFIIRYLPAPIRLFIKRLGMQDLFNNLIVKPEGELIYQTAAVDIIKNYRNEVERYWREYRLLDETIKICKFSRKTRVLDVGCGIVTVLHFIKGRKHGLDPLAKQLRKLYKYPSGIEVFEGVAEDIPFPNKYFDVVFCTNVLDHVEDPIKCLSEMARVLKDDGYFVFSIHFAINSKSKVCVKPTHTFNFTEKEVLVLLKKDFEVVQKKKALGVDLHSYLNNLRAENNELTIILKKERSTF